MIEKDIETYMNMLLQDKRPWPEGFDSLLDKLNVFEDLSDEDKKLAFTIQKEVKEYKQSRVFDNFWDLVIEIGEYMNKSDYHVLISADDPKSLRMGYHGHGLYPYFYIKVQDIRGLPAPFNDIIHNSRTRHNYFNSKEFIDFFNSEAGKDFINKKKNEKDKLESSPMRQLEKKTKKRAGENITAQLKLMSESNNPERVRQLDKLRMDHARDWALLDALQSAMPWPKTHDFDNNGRLKSDVMTTEQRYAATDPAFTTLKCVKCSAIMEVPKGYTSDPSCMNCAANANDGMGI